LNDIIQRLANKFSVSAGHLIHKEKSMNTKKAICLIVLTFVFLLMPVFSADSKEDPEKEKKASDIQSLFEKIDEEMPRDLAEFNVPGAAIALIQNGEIVAKKGYGFADMENSIPVTPTTGFNIGSISKTIAAWGVMTLVEKGKLDLDAPVSTYLSRWRLPESEFNEDGVTLRRLLSHTAGLSLHGYPGWKPDDELPTLEESLSGKTNGSGDVRLIMEPGTKWEYSGGGYTLAQLIIEEVTGQSFADYMRQAVLRPLGMSNSDYQLTEKILSKSSLAYDETGMPTYSPRFTAKAAAGLQTTVEDLAIFAAAALSGKNGQTPGRDVLMPETVELMLTPAPASNNRYGLGYEVMLMPDGRRANGHGGANRGWRATFGILPETGDGLVIMNNSTNGSHLNQKISQFWLSWLLEK
jgi:CubicO group peptidase (beta-lactamase class C family)